MDTRQLLADYGADITTVRGALRHCGLARRPISSAAHYVAAVRRCRPDLGWSTTPAWREWVQDPYRYPSTGLMGRGYWQEHGGEKVCGMDGRLIGCGYNLVPPSWWRDQGNVDAWARYWECAAGRPDRVESPYNPSPMTAFEGFLRGIPPRYVAVLGDAAIRGRRRQRLSRSRYVLLRRAARAAGRTSFPRRDGDYRPDTSEWSLKALAALGRLSPELQRAALDATMAELGARGRVDDMSGCITGGPVLARDIAWEAAARAQRHMLASPRVRIAWATGRRQEALAAAAGYGGYTREGLAQWLANGHPLEVELKGCGPEVVSMVLRGYPMERVAAEWRPLYLPSRRDRNIKHDPFALTRQEALRWIREAASISPKIWADEHYDVPRRRNAAVLRWMIDVRQRGDWPLIELERSRVIDGERHWYRYSDRLDEVRDGHLVHGPKTSVRRVMDQVVDSWSAQLARDSAARREREARDEAYRQSLDDVISTWPAFFPPLLPGMVLLDTRRKLAQEGEQMNHCIGMEYHGWPSRVARGEVWAVSVTGRDGSRATVTLHRDQSIAHNLSKHNSAPSQAVQDLMDAWSGQGQAVAS